MTAALLLLAGGCWAVGILAAWAVVAGGAARHRAAADDFDAWLDLEVTP